MTSHQTDISAILASPLPSPEEMEASFRVRLANAFAWTNTHLIGPAAIKMRQPGDAPARFNTLSLPSWLAVAARAGVPAIPARQVTSIETRTYLECMNAPAEAHPAMDDFEITTAAALKEGEVLRFEQVAPAEVKEQRSAGQELGNGMYYSNVHQRQILTIYDERFFTTLLDLGSDTIRAYARPKVEAAMIDGVFGGTPGSWPMEFRVFVENGAIVGVSNYYPQIDLDPAAVHAEARLVARRAQMMVEAMTSLRLCIGNHALNPDQEAGARPGRPTWIPETWSEQSFTLDFLVSREGDVLFLEGGPAGLVAAHPCCFAQPGRKANDPSFLHGWASSLDRPILPLEALGA